MSPIDLSQLQYQTQTPDNGIPTSVTVTLANFEREVLKRSEQVPVILLIGLPSSHASDQLRRCLGALAKKREHEFIFGYVDTEATPEVAALFELRDLPTVVAMAQRHPIAHFLGTYPDDEVEAWVDGVIKACDGRLTGLLENSEPEDPKAQEAVEAVNRADFEAAFAIYQAMLDEDPANAAAKQGIATTRLLQRVHERGTGLDAVSLADADPHNTALALDAADALMTAGKVEESFRRLTSLLGEKFGTERDQLRERLLELIATQAPSDPRVLAARSDLANALF